MSEEYCNIAFDHQPGEICPECNLQVDEFGNTEADFRNCTFPCCGCDGSRLCMAPNGPNESSSSSNIEGAYTMKGSKGEIARIKLLGACYDYNKKEKEEK